MKRSILGMSIVIAFVAGTIATGTVAFAASNTQGQPFEQIRDKVDKLENDIKDLDDDVLSVDSFFDISYRIDFSPDNCPEPDEIPKLNDELTDTECSSEFAVDSFFDVFYDITLDTKSNTERLDALQADLVELQLNSHDSSSGTAITTYIKDATVTGESNKHCSVIAECETGDVAVSGGYDTRNQVNIYQNLPTGLPESNSWTVTGFNEAESTVDIKAHVVCLDKTP